MSGGFFDLSSPTFKPTVRLISSISKGSTTTIITDRAHDYVDGMIVRIVVPTRIDTAIGPTSLAGMPQINGRYGKITIVDEYTFTIDIDSTDFDTFAIPGTWIKEEGVYPQAVPMGEDLSVSADVTGIAAVRNVL